MAPKSKEKEKIEAIELRKQGLSYKKIVSILNVSKRSITRWCKNIQLTAVVGKVLGK